MDDLDRKSLDEKTGLTLFSSRLDCLLSSLLLSALLKRPARVGSGVDGDKRRMDEDHFQESDLPSRLDHEKA